MLLSTKKIKNHYL